MAKNKIQIWQIIIVPIILAIIAIFPYIHERIYSKPNTANYLRYYISPSTLTITSNSDSIIVFPANDYAREKSSIDLKINGVEIKDVGEQKNDSGFYWVIKIGLIDDTIFDIDKLSNENLIGIGCIEENLWDTIMLVFEPVQEVFEEDIKNNSDFIPKETSEIITEKKSLNFADNNSNRDKATSDFVGKSYYEVTGSCIINARQGQPFEQAKLLAIKGAQLDATGQLNALINGVSVQTEAELENYLNVDSRTKVISEGLLSGAYMVGQPIVEGSIVRVKMRINKQHY